MNSFQTARAEFEAAFPTPIYIYWDAEYGIYRPRPGLDPDITDEAGNRTSMFDVWCKAIDVKETQIFKMRQSIINAALPPRPMCRDCADNAGICENSGMPCDPFEHAIVEISNLLALKTKLENKS